MDESIVVVVVVGSRSSIFLLVVVGIGEQQECAPPLQGVQALDQTGAVVAHGLGLIQVTQLQATGLLDRRLVLLNAAVPLQL